MEKKSWFQSLSELMRRHFPSHESFYLNEKNASWEPRETEEARLYNRMRQDIGVMMWR